MSKSGYIDPIMLVSLDHLLHRPMQ